MTADLDLSPEAVERLLSLPRLYLDHEGDLCCERTGDNLVACPAVGDQPTSGLLNPDMWEAIPQFQTLARTLAAENTRLRAERDEQRERAEEAESEITRAQEQVSAEFEGDCWKAMRNLLERTGFDWSEYSEDGVSASEAQRWIVEELDRLEAERDAAWQAGAEAMRERAAYEVAESGAIVDHPSVFMGGPSRNAIRIAGAFAAAIRDLPLPEQPQ